MKKGLIFGIGIVAILIIFFTISYNSLVGGDEEVESEFSNISVQLERRADLIPNLLNTVKGYMAHERSVIDSVTTARQELVNANNVGKMADANEELTSALNNLFVIVENYPDLKSNINFIQLQDELAGTENRIAVARQDYNDAVKTYNKARKSFPKSIISSMFGFDEREYFEAKQGVNEVPDVSFEKN